VWGVWYSTGDSSNDRDKLLLTPGQLFGSGGIDEVAFTISKRPVCGSTSLVGRYHILGMDNESRIVRWLSLGSSAHLHLTHPYQWIIISLQRQALHHQNHVIVGDNHILVGGNSWCTRWKTTQTTLQGMQLALCGGTHASQHYDSVHEKRLSLGPTSIIQGK